MTLSLHQRLLLVVMLPAALLAAGIAGLFVARGTQAVDDALGDRGLAIVSFLAPAAEYGVISGNRSSLATLLQAVLEQRDVVAVAVYDRSGEPLAISGRLHLAVSSHVMEVGAAQIVDRRQDRLALAAPVVAAPMAVDDGDLLDLGFAENRYEGAIGWVYVELDTRALADEKRTILLGALVLALCGLAFTAWLAVRMADSVTAPIAGLADAVGGVARGEPDIAVGEDSPIKELRVLQGGFNAMAQAISEAHQNLQSRVDEATAQLAHQALHDPLTGLPNRRAFEQALDASVGASRRAGDQDTLCFIDLDRFKIVNDTCGHAAGDELLCRIAHMLRQRVRADDLICRIGGDEFALILHGCGAEKARRIAEQLREAIASLRFTWRERRFTVGASMGLVPIDGGASSADVLVAADLACYAAKKGGRNRIVEHAPDLSGELGSLERPPTPRLDSIPYERLRLYGQAIVPVLAHPSDAWCEVLLRVQSEDDEVCVPDELLAGLEGSDGGLALDLWVADQACALTGPMMPEGDAICRRMALSVTRDSIMHAAAYFAGLAESMREYGVEPERVVLQIRAATAEQCPGETAAFMQAAHALGCRIAIDRLDGWASAQLKTLKPDYVRISFRMLAEAYGMEAGCNLAQALCGMAAALAIPTVACEVEDALFRDALEDYGFDFAQGTALAAPEPLCPIPSSTGDTPQEAPRADG
ncbi:MAG TPA: diguanylate cyclase [Rhodocyclaceae bacterium]|nr:diguanylate cyclase [Rhodocyclaceae bacterium]